MPLPKGNHFYIVFVKYICVAYSISFIYLLQIQALGFVEKYPDDDAFEHQVKMVATLSFLPPVDVTREFDFVLEFERLVLPHEFFGYFERTWIGAQVGIARRLEPDYSIALWNCRTAALDLEPRTTNAVEEWHQGLKSAITCDRPSLWRFLEGLQLCQATTELRIEHARALVQDVTPRKKYKDRTLRLQELTRGYDHDHIIAFLRSIAYMAGVRFGGGGP